MRHGVLALAALPTRSVRWYKHASNICNDGARGGCPASTVKIEQKSVATLALFSLDRHMGSCGRTQGRGYKMRPYGSFREGEHGYVV